MERGERRRKRMRRKCKMIAGRILDGRTWNEMPVELNIMKA
jgi:protein gp37